MATIPSITISGTLQKVARGGEFLVSLLASSTDEHLLILEVDQVQVQISIDDNLVVFTLDPVELRITGPTTSTDGKD